MTELLQIKSLRCSKYKDTTRQTAMHPGSKCSSTMHRFANSANVGNRYTFASVDCMYKPAAKYVERHKQREADARLGKGEKSLQRGHAVDAEPAASIFRKSLCRSSCRQTTQQ